MANNSKRRGRTRRRCRNRFLPRWLGALHREELHHVHGTRSADPHLRHLRRSSRGCNYPNDEYHTAGQFGGTDFDKVRALLAPFTQLAIHKGDVSASLPHLAESTYRLVHIDTDLYQPTVVCLDYFGDRMCRGGVIVVDDYGAKKCAGVATAVTEYLAQTDDFHAWDMRTDQLVLVRR
jgi:hypothetical protein